ncbi:MAG: MFS transporter [Pelistega sp.]|nr:MFS transporter [Pelistega sp.]
MKDSTGIKIFFLFAFAYFISNLFRGVNVAFAPFLIDELQLTATSLGLLTSIYFIAFALFQIPAGLALDKWGPKRTHAVLLFICALGGLIYALADSFTGLLVGRILIGIGIAVGLAGSILIYTQNFPLARLPMLTGLTVAIGGLGGVVVGAPLTFALEYFHWSSITVVISIITVIIAGGIWFLLPDTHTSRHLSFKAQCQGTIKIFKTPTFWRWVALPAATGGMFYAAHTLWVRSYMSDVLHYSPAEIAGYVSLIGISMVLGTASTGLLARRVEAWGINLHYFSGIGMLSFMLIQFLLILEVPVPPAITWFVFGFAGSSWTVNFAYGAEIFPAHILGRVTTSYNVVFFSAIFLTQLIIGYILDMWDKLPNGQYPAIAHMTAWSFFLAIQSLAAIISFWPRPLKVDSQHFEE